jgi:hypothetical protein
MFNYTLPPNATDHKFLYDGSRVYMDINLGNITYMNSQGAKELYKVKRIELHYPAEHYITINGQTPRYPLELQIYHEIIETNNLIITNQFMHVNQAAVSIMFTLGDLEEGDIFLNSLGISKYNTNDQGKFFIAAPGSHIDRTNTVPASYRVGFNNIAFQGLLNLLNSDDHMYFYYGSETIPPCKEDVLWMVFAKPRSLSKPQFDYLLLMLGKHKEEGKPIADAKTPNQLYGNKRALFVYDEIDRGTKILSNPVGSKNVNNRAFFKTDD